MILGVGLATIGGAILWLLLAPRQESSPSTSQDLSDEPNLFIQSAEILEFADDGSLAYKATASSVEHSTDDQSVTLHDIHVEVYLDTGIQWQMTASSGILHPLGDSPPSGKEQRIDLLGDVLVTSRDAETTRLSLMGSNFVLYPHQRKLGSDHPVTIKNENASFTAPSFEFDLESDEFRLSSNSEQRVQVVYRHD